MNTALVRVIKAVAGVIVLVVLLSVVTRWWGEYKEGETESPPTATSTATSTVAAQSAEASRAAAVKAGMKLVVLADGLNMRKNSSREADVVRGLKEGEKLTVLNSKPGWYQVQDAKKKKGWISSSPSYSKVVK